MNRISYVLAAAALVSIAAPAAATPPQVPDLSWSDVPDHILVVARNATGGDATLGQVNVTVRDLAGNGMAADVVLDFSGAPDVALSAVPENNHMTIDCAKHWVTIASLSNGVTTFTLVGTGTSAPASPPNAVNIYANGVPFGSVSVAVLDRDGLNGVTTADLSVWAEDFFGGANPPRADLDGDGSVSLADVSVLAAAYFSGNEVQSGSPFCP